MRRRALLLCLCALIAVLSAALLHAEKACDKEYPPAASLDWTPVGGKWVAGYSQGIASVLGYLGHSVHYDTIMGDAGIAFIAQGEEDSTNVIDGAVDVGWWPIDPLGMNIRLNFLEQATGRRLTYLPADAELYRQDPVAHYHKQFAPAVKAAIANGRPCLAMAGCWFIDSGYDEEEIALLGNCTLVAEKQLIRAFQQPFALLVPGDPVDPMDRKQADLAALRYAVALHRDEVLGASDAHATEAWGAPLRDPEAVGKQWRTGQKTFAAWVKALRDAEHPSRADWNANMLGHLTMNRGSAIRYLNAMARRQPGAVALHLRYAAARYEQIRTLLKQGDTSEAAFSTAEGREALAQLIEQVAAREEQAIAEIENALAAATP